MTKDRLDELLARFRSLRVLVVGDLMLDEFIWGKVGRISPEAPVPVVEVQRESCYPGGSANVARNLREFCDQVGVTGLIGPDRAGGILRALLEEAGIGMDGVVEDDARPTILKTRVIARQQQVVRVDRERKSLPEAAIIERLLGAYAAALPRTDAVILQDYGKGLFRQDLTDRLIALAREAGVLVTADINQSNPVQWTGVDAVKPNRAEAFAAAGTPLTDPVDPVLADTALMDVCGILRDRWRCRLLLVTLGEQGMLLFDSGGSPFLIPTRAREVFDVSGAGDTAIALFTLSLAAGADAREAAEVANHASGVAVGKLGTATVSPGELMESFENHG